MEFLQAFLLLTFLFLFFKLLGYKLRSKPRPKLPPGPWKLPIIGSLHHLLGDSRLHYKLRDLAKVYGPLMHFKFGEVSAIVVSSPEVAIEVFKKHDTAFAERPRLLFVKMLFRGHDVSFAPYGEYWRQMRKIIVQELLSVGCVQSFRRIREEEGFNHMQSIVAANSLVINLSEKLGSLTNDITLRAVIGAKSKYQEELMIVIKEFFGLLGGFNLADLFPSSHSINLVSGMKRRIEICCEKTDRLFGDIIQERRENKMAKMNSSTATEYKQENLLDVLLRLQQQGGLKFPLTDDVIKAVLYDLISGGTETTAATLSWAMSELMRNPRVMQKAQAEIRDTFQGKREVSEVDINGLKYLQLIIKETLRVHPPGPLLAPRECREECEILGYRIPVGTRLVVNAWAISTDPKYWDNPNEFMPERFAESLHDLRGNTFEYMPFSVGRRMCPGMAFGIAAMELPLAQLLYYFNWKLQDGTEPHQLDMSENCGLAVVRKTPLLVHVTPYISIL